MSSAIKSQRDELVAILAAHEKHIRDDYAELVFLVQLFIGAKTTEKFNAPGAMHRARWMAKAIYTVKIYMFRRQFKLTRSEEKGLRDLTLFIILVYIRAWVAASFPLQAPLNDWQLMTNLLQYPGNKTVAKSALKKLEGHFWYLSEELVCLGLFDERIPDEKKREMVQALDNEAPENPPKRPHIPETTFTNGQGLEQLVTKNSRFLLNSMNIDASFLLEDPTVWNDNETYKRAKQSLSNLSVVNDRAERAVALIQDLNRKLTKGEDQLQFLLQVVAEHRKKFPKPTKESLIQ